MAGRADKKEKSREDLKVNLGVLDQLLEKEDATFEEDFGGICDE